VLYTEIVLARRTPLRQVTSCHRKSSCVLTRGWFKYSL